MNSNAYFTFAELPFIMMYITLMIGHSVIDERRFRTIESMIVVTNIFSVGVFTFLSCVLKDEGVLWSIATFIFFPMAMFSGAIFPYRSMPLWMQKVGSFFPQRWISRSIEVIQKQNSIVPALLYIVLILATAVVFYALAVYNTGKTRKAV